jgi:hypothetical protein
VYNISNKSFEPRCKRLPRTTRWDCLVSNLADRISSIERGGKDVNKSNIANKQRAA